MADEDKKTQRRRVPKTPTPLRSTTRWIAERGARAEARSRDLEFIEAFLATPGPSTTTFVNPRPATPFDTRSEFMQGNRPEFYAGAANPQYGMEYEGRNTGTMFNLPVFESTHLLPRTQTPLRSTTLRTVEQAARRAGPFSRPFVVPRSAPSYKPRSEIRPVNRPEFNAGATNPQRESAGPSTRPTFDKPAPENMHLLFRTQTLLQSITRRTVEHTTRGAEQTRKIELESTGPCTGLIFNKPSAEGSHVVAAQQPGTSRNHGIQPKRRNRIAMQENLNNTTPEDGGSTPYETQSESIPINRPGFNADAANLQLESAEPCTGLLFDQPSPEDSHVIAAQKPGTSQNHGIQPKRRNRIAMQENPNNKPPEDGDSTPYETQYEIIPRNRPGFNADAANPQLESAGPCTGLIFDKPSPKDSHVVAAQQPGTSQNHGIQPKRRNRIAMQENPKNTPPEDGGSTPYGTQSEIIPMNRSGFNADAANLQLESAGPCTGLIFDKPSPEDSHVVAAQQPGTSQNHGIRPQRRNRIAMQENPNNTASADGGSASK